MFCICWVLLCSKRSIFSAGRMLLWTPVEDGFVFGTFFFFLNANVNLIYKMLLKNRETSDLPVHWFWKLNFLSFMHMKWTLHWAVQSHWQTCVCKQEIIETNNKQAFIENLLICTTTSVCTLLSFPLCYPSPPKKPSRKKWDIQLLRLLIQLSSWFIDWNYSGSWWLVWESDNELYFPNKIQFYPSLVCLSVTWCKTSLFAWVHVRKLTFSSVFTNKIFCFGNCKDCCVWEVDA